MREKGHEVGQLDRAPIRELLRLRPVNETLEQRGVSFLRVLGLAAFVAQVLQEIFDQCLHLLVLAADQSHIKHGRAGWPRTHAAVHCGLDFSHDP